MTDLSGKKILAAGHICLDITPVFNPEISYSAIEEALVPGNLVHVGSPDIHTGGSVANTGLTFKKLGADVRLLSKVGDDEFGHMVIDILRRYGTGGIIVDGNTSTSYSIVMAVPGIDRIFLHNPGANNSFYSGDIPDEAFEDACLLHFGYPPLMKSIYENNGAELKKIFVRAKEHGLLTSLDMAAVSPDTEAGRLDWIAFLSEVLPYTDYFVPSFEEICFMLDRNLYDSLNTSGDIIASLDMENHVKPIADRLLRMGAGTVMIKCGTAGLYYTNGEECGIQPCFAVDRVCSATGSGDTCIAAFLYSLLSGYSLKESVELAAAEGACCVTAYDALSGLLPLDELRARIKDGWKTVR